MKVVGSRSQERNYIHMGDLSLTQRQSCSVSLMTHYESLKLHRQSFFMTRLIVWSYSRLCANTLSTKDFPFIEGID